MNRSPLSLAAIVLGLVLAGYAVLTASSGCNQAPPAKQPKQPAKPKVQPAPTPDPEPAPDVQPAPKPRNPRCPNCPAGVDNQCSVFSVQCSAKPELNTESLKTEHCCACHPQKSEPVGSCLFTTEKYADEHPDWMEEAQGIFGAQPPRLIGAARPCSDECTCGCAQGGRCTCRNPWSAAWNRSLRKRTTKRTAQPVEAYPEPMVDLLSMPLSLRPHNVGGRDGAGLCVFTTQQWHAWFQGETALQSLQTQMRQEPGGGTPGKLAAMIGKYGPSAEYLQVEGRDTVPTIEAALKTGRPVGITWQANHMLSCCHLDAQYGAILDNNVVDHYQWFNRADFIRRHQAGGGGWVVVLKKPPAPPPPKNAKQPQQRRAQVIGAVREQFFPRPFRGNNGMDWRPSSTTTTYRTNHGEIGAAEARRWLASLDDDSARPFLTIIGPTGATSPVVKDLQTSPALAPWKGKFLVKALPSTDWSLKNFGFKTDGYPSIYLQARDGTVLLRQDGYAGGAEGLAAAINNVQGLRKKDDSYSPAKDPNGQPKTPAGPEAAGIPSIPWSYPAVAGLALLGYGVVSVRKRGA